MVIVAGWALGVSAGAQSVIYVNPSATGANDGTSWADAFTDLYTALASGSVDGPREFWVAAGTYRAGATEFRLRNAALYGGFGGHEERRDDRQPDVHRCVLSADRNGDDGAAFSNRGDNAATILGIEAPGESLVDGITFVGAREIAIEVWRRARIQNCVFTDNTAVYGAIKVLAGVVDISRCLFFRNRGGTWASAIDAGAYNIVSIDACSFHENLSALACVKNTGSRLTITNCVFTNNSRDQNGYAIYSNAQVSLESVANCTFFNNGARPVQFSADSPITNSIIWDENPLNLRPSRGAFSYCNVGFIPLPPGPGNVRADPMFADPAGPDGVVGTPDDDLRLLPGSPCIDAGNNDVDLDSSTPEIERLPAFDLVGRERFLDDPQTPDSGVGSPPIVDLGAREFRPPLAGDANCDGLVNNFDVDAFLVAMRGEAEYSRVYPACDRWNCDLNGDGAVNNFDVDPFVALLIGG